ncbi:MAG: hypothetical protein IPJ32_14745 [Sphingobacteriaceae bacterium]|nr:hypothetical protein [Sphingobacteriaceae bacterium]
MGFTLRNIFLVSIALLLSNCRKKKELIEAEPTQYEISGVVQKGPFNIGTSITLFELDQNFIQTGKSFNGQISDNSGTFQLGKIPISTNFVIARADGFYFNEVCGSNSSSQITLNCITKTGTSNPININLLTHLEKPRVEYLLSQGEIFDSAKVKAQREVLNIFNYSSSGIQQSENLDITQSGDGNAKLLAISCIMQGFRTEAELSSILSTISSDIRTDGILNDAAIKSSLIDHAVFLDTTKIKNNITNFYTSLGMSITIPNFEKYVKHFVLNSGYASGSGIFMYPANGNYGNNILEKTQLNYNNNVGLTSLTASTKKCSSFKIRLKTLTSGPGGFAINQGTGQNLAVVIIGGGEMIFTVLDTALPFDMQLSLHPGNTILVEYYEGPTLVPTFSKTITVI